MDITYFGHSCFRLRGKNASLVTDPYDSAMVGFKLPKLSTEIVTVSHDHADHNKSEKIADVKRVIMGPGEYEISGISVLGLPSYHDDKKGEERGKNTIYVFEIDDLRLCHLGDLGHTLSEEMVEIIGTIDILMVPCGGFYTISAEQAAEVVREIEPSIIIPMHYFNPGMNKESFGKLTPVDDFIKTTGLSVEKTEKLSLKRGDIEEDGQKIVVLEVKR